MRRGGGPKLIPEGPHMRGEMRMRTQNVGSAQKDLNPASAPPPLLHPIIAYSKQLPCGFFAFVIIRCLLIMSDGLKQKLDKKRGINYKQRVTKIMLNKI